MLQTQFTMEFNPRQTCHEIAEKSSRIVPRARSIDLDHYAHPVCRAGLPWSVRYSLLSRMASQTASHGSTGALRVTAPRAPRLRIRGRARLPGPCVARVVVETHESGNCFPSEFDCSWVDSDGHGRGSAAFRRPRFVRCSWNAWQRMAMVAKESVIADN